jgi:DNA-binding MarR family transcriptional regulator
VTAETAPDWSAEQRPPPAIGALLRMAAEIVAGGVFDALAEAGFADLRHVHVPLFHYPGVDGLRPGEIAARRGLSKQAVNDLLRDLESLGYLRLQPDPDDGRARRVRLTKRGNAMMDTLRTHSVQVGRRWADLLGAERFADLERALQEIVRSEPRRTPIRF